MTETNRHRHPRHTAPHTQVVMEADTRGRITLSALDAEGLGHGYRLAGPKCIDGGGRVVARRVLDRRDVEEIRRYLALADEVLTVGSGL